MRKFLCLAVSLLMVVSLMSLAGCGGKSTLKFGMGINAYYETATDADGETDGKGEVVLDIAAVSVDKDGKIVDCVIDTADNSVAYTSEGKMVEAGEFKTKLELGDNYGMVQYGGAELEWYEQVEALCDVVKGKTMDEVAALVVDGYGDQEVINAGCTIAISGFVSAIEKAVNNATESNVTDEAMLKLGVESSVGSSSKDASEEADGTIEVDTTVFAAAIDADGKVIDAKTDSVTAGFTFDLNGAATVDTATAISTKNELGDSYGMSAYGTDLNGDGKVLEWDEQAEAFSKVCMGLTADEISALVADKGYGSDELQKAGCTINVSSMVKAAVKSASIS